MLVKGATGRQHVALQSINSDDNIFKLTANAIDSQDLRHILQKVYELMIEIL